MSSPTTALMLRWPRLMGEAGLQGIYRRRRGTTRRDPSAEPNSDLVDRNFTVHEPNRLWVTWLG